MFYRVGDPYGEFSNFAPYPIRLKDREWPTNEPTCSNRAQGGGGSARRGRAEVHYFQAQKFAGTRHEEAVRLAASPMQAAKMGRDRDRALRPDWEEVKDEVMREAVLAKFEQHPDVLGLLLSTGDAEIVEHTRNDSYWGDGGDGSGLNMLGRILMDVRRELGGG
jgi:ribA/ribD-fused uncharacterized protein